MILSMKKERLALFFYWVLMSCWSRVCWYILSFRCLGIGTVDIFCSQASSSALIINILYRIIWLSTILVMVAL